MPNFQRNINFEHLFQYGCIFFGFRFYEGKKAGMQCNQIWVSSDDDNNNRTKKGQNEQQLGILPAQRRTRKGDR